MVFVAEGGVMSAYCQKVTRKDLPDSSLCHIKPQSKGGGLCFRFVLTSDCSVTVKLIDINWSLMVHSPGDRLRDWLYMKYSTKNSCWLNTEKNRKVLCIEESANIWTVYVTTHINVLHPYGKKDLLLLSYFTNFFVFKNAVIQLSEVIRPSKKSCCLRRGPGLIRVIISHCY